MSNYNFKKDFERSVSTEIDIATKLTTKGGPFYYDGEATVLWPPSGKAHLPWDFEIIDQASTVAVPVRIEVKEDFKAKVTGNIAVETWCRDNPSGITTSQADYWVYRVHTSNDSFIDYMILTSVLKGLISDRRVREVIGGDKGSNTVMKLLPLTVFELFAEEIHPPKKEELDD